MQYIIWPAALLSGLGILFGIVLAVASKFFSVEVSQKVVEVREALPGINCGACGYPGCDAFAKAIVDGSEPVNGCPVSNDDGVAELATIMGVEVSSVDPLIAFVRCQGTLQNTHIKYDYDGLTDCGAASVLADGFKTCKFSCLGLGNCERICPTDAISIISGVAVVEDSKCISCGKCVLECPRNIIAMLPKTSEVRIDCRATAKGKDVRTACNVGCIGCTLCEKACKFDAITMVDDLPIIDYDKCNGCRACVDKCPRECIWENDNRQIALIADEGCIGCTLCTRACKFDAIEGIVKEKHTIIADKCTGCKECVAKCPTKVISMIDR